MSRDDRQRRIAARHGLACPPSLTFLPAEPTPGRDRLKAFLLGHDVELVYEALAPGLLGHTDGRRITCGLGQPAHVEFWTLVYETTHVLLHFPRDGGARRDLVTRDTEAEAVAYQPCAQLGIEGTEASIDYIRSYRGTPGTREASQTHIRDTARQHISEPASVRIELDDEPVA